MVSCFPRVRPPEEVVRGVAGSDQEIGAGGRSIGGEPPGVHLVSITPRVPALRPGDDEASVGLECDGRLGLASLLPAPISWALTYSSLSHILNERAVPGRNGPAKGSRRSEPHEACDETRSSCLRARPDHRLGPERGDPQRLSPEVHLPGHLPPAMLVRKWTVDHLLSILRRNLRALVSRSQATRRNSLTRAPFLSRGAQACPALSSRHPEEGDPALSSGTLGT